VPAGVGNCVGEENHLPFFCYLIFQNLHLTLELFMLINSSILSGKRRVPTETEEPFQEFDCL
jgi:hypothetical protein